MKYTNLALAFLFSVLSCCSIETAHSQTSGMPSPIDGQPISDKSNGFDLGFGDDDRRPMRSSAFPWSAVGRVQIDGGGHCTGTLVGRDLVLTNAHCIWVDGQRRNITFAPNYRNGQAPETVKGINYWWGTSNPGQNRRSDWAVIRLERPIGDRYRWFDWQLVSYEQLRDMTVNYAGYSTFGDEMVREFINGETAQVHVGCQVRDVYPNNGVIHTDCDNGRGGSGGPIFIWQNNRPFIVAINAAEYRSDPDGSSYFTQNYTPGQGNVGVPNLEFLRAIGEAQPRMSDRLGAFQRLRVNESLWSRNGQYRLVMQGDGNLVVYGPKGASWAARTNHSNASNSFLEMQGDGNLVVYGPKGALWDARTNHSNTSNSYLVMQDDGNLVVYGSRGALWDRYSRPNP